ncbi:MAG: oligosaccharide flippase family protein [Candidatus Peregrinibacteria bacterium]|nr:oligosaccharide flippase family protein [Candidatus Peregrinibacteria bacterium]
MTLPNYSLSILGKKIAFSAIVQLAGKVLQIILSAVSLKLISNFLTQEGYGVYASITEYALFFSAVGNLGIFGNVVRLMSEKPNDSKIFTNALFVRAFTGIFFFVIAILICILNGSSEAFTIGTALFCSALLFDLLTTVCDGMLQSNYLMGRATAALILGRIVQVAMLFWIVKNVGSLQQFWILGAAMVGSLFTFLISIFLVAQKIKINWKLEWGTMLLFFKKSLPYGIIFITNNLYFRFIPDYLANNFLSDAHFASFNISFRISQVLSLASTFIMFSALPGLTEYIDGKHYEKAKKLFFSLQKIFLIAGVALVVFGSLIGPYAIAILTHAKYNIPELSFILPMMLVLAAVSYGYDLVFLSLFAAGKDIWFMWREFIGLGLSFIFFLASYFTSDMTEKMILILLGAIAGETIMVILGTIKMRKIFRGHPTPTL